MSSTTSTAKRVEPSVRGRLLVIDDEELMTRVLMRVLRCEHDVVATTSAAAAIERLAQGELFDAVVCDVHMPHMDGVQVFEWIRAHRPELAGSFMFLTGGVPDVATAGRLAALPVPCMYKPFAPNELRRLVTTLVAASD